MSDDDSSSGSPRRKGGEIEGGITSVEEVFKSLLKPRRRFVLYSLRDEEVATVTELAQEIAAWENGIPPAHVDDDQQKRIATSLAHNHLPQMADSLFIEYDRRSNTARYSDPPVLLDEVLQLLDQLENR
jgi:DNA-binding transcriptional ArsR family regulator